MFDLDMEGESQLLHTKVSATNSVLSYTKV